jgi:hypothetical protein
MILPWLRADPLFRKANLKNLTAASRREIARPVILPIRFEEATYKRVTLRVAPE